MTETTKPGASRLRKEAILFGLLFSGACLHLALAVSRLRRPPAQTEDEAPQVVDQPGS
ncbi:MAG: hypothetical protein WBN34_13645 [Woeseia sp.]